MKSKYIVSILSVVVLLCILINYLFINPEHLKFNNEQIRNRFIGYITYKNNQKGLYLYLVDNQSTVKNLKLDTLYEGEAFKKPRLGKSIKQIVFTTSPLYDVARISYKLEKLPNSNKCLLYSADSIFRFNCYMIPTDIRNKIGYIDEWKSNEIGFWKPTKP